MLPVLRDPEGHRFKIPLQSWAGCRPQMASQPRPSSLVCLSRAPVSNPKFTHSSPPTWEAAGRERQAPHSSRRGVKAEELQKLYLLRRLRKRTDQEMTLAAREGFLQEEPFELECRMGRKEEGMGTAWAQAARYRSTRCGLTASKCAEEALRLL